MSSRPRRARRSTSASTIMHTPESLQRCIADAKPMPSPETCGVRDRDRTAQVSGVAFLTKPGASPICCRSASQDVTGDAPEFSTTGGTSDARFIKDHCPVAELGLPGGTMHKADECVPVDGDRIADATSTHRSSIAISRNHARRRVHRHLRFRHGRAHRHARADGAAAARTLRLSRRHGAASLWHQERRHGDALCRAGGERAGAARDVKLLVVACNTASVVALPALAGGVRAVAGHRRDRTGRAKPRWPPSPDGPIAVIATEGTVKGGAYRARHPRPRRPMCR